MTAEATPIKGGEKVSTDKDGTDIECDREGERRRVQLVAETGRDVRI